MCSNWIGTCRLSTHITFFSRQLSIFGRHPYINFSMQLTRKPNPWQREFALVPAPALGKAAGYVMGSLQSAPPLRESFPISPLPQQRVSWSSPRSIWIGVEKREREMRCVGNIPPSIHMSHNNQAFLNPAHVGMTTITCEIIMHLPQ